jgi:hypothetical protein
MWGEGAIAKEGGQQGDTTTLACHYLYGTVLVIHLCLCNQETHT